MRSDHLQVVMSNNPMFVVAMKLLTSSFVIGGGFVTMSLLTPAHTEDVVLYPVGISARRAQYLINRLLKVIHDVRGSSGFATPSGRPSSAESCSSASTVDGDQGGERSDTSHDRREEGGPPPNTPEHLAPIRRISDSPPLTTPLLDEAIEPDTYDALVRVIEKQERLDLHQTNVALTITTSTSRIQVMRKVYASSEEVAAEQDIAPHQIVIDRHGIWLTRLAAVSFWTGLFPMELYNLAAPNTYWLRVNDALEKGWRLIVTHHVPGLIASTKLKTRHVSGSYSYEMTPTRCPFRPSWPDALDLESVGSSILYYWHVLPDNGSAKSPFATPMLRRHFNKLMEGNWWRIDEECHDSTAFSIPRLLFNIDESWWYPQV
jgi:hypothetical protein